MTDFILPEAAVHDYLGIKKAPPVASVHIQILNALGHRWLHADDVLTWLDRNAESLDLGILRRLVGELREATRSR